MARKNHLGRNKRTGRPFARAEKQKSLFVCVLQEGKRDGARMVVHPRGGPGRLRLSVLRSRCRRGRSLNEKVKHKRIEFKRKRTRICLKLRLLAWKRRVSRQLATKSGLPRQRAWDRAKPRGAHGAVNGAMGNFSEPKRTAPLELAMPRCRSEPSDRWKKGCTTRSPRTTPICRFEKWATTKLLDCSLVVHPIGYGLAHNDSRI